MAGAAKLMNPRATLKIYPRPDTYYKNKASLDFDMMRTKIMVERKGSSIESIAIWGAHILCGFVMGIIAFLLSLAEDQITLLRCDITQKLIGNDNSLGLSYLFWTSTSIIFVLIAALLTVYVGPASMGSGVAEVMGLLNGVNYTDAIGLKTLFVKCFGTLFAICGGLCIGKEGPLVHIGANIGVIVCYVPMKIFEYLQNDVIKRQMMAAGASCGVSVAFGAPIGGALFSYEISKPNTFWTFSMLWRVFTATSFATFTLSLLKSISTGAPLSLSDSGSLKFGNVGESGENSMLDLPAAIILGVITGLMGALFIHCSISLGMYRKKYVNTPIKKVIECCIFAFITSSSFYAVVAARKNYCNPKIEGAEEEFRFACPSDQYNPLATLIFNTEGGTIRQFFRYPEIVANQEQKGITSAISIYLVLWYFFTITTFGIWVPAGVFVPGMLIGCSLGVLYLELLLYGFDMNLIRVGGQSYLVIGASAMLSSYTRLTYSLAVIMMETTQAINMFLAIMISIMVSHGVARLFNRSLYEYSIRSKQMPLLRNHVPKENENIRVRDMIKALFDGDQQLEVVESVSTVERLIAVLQKEFSTIPVVNMHGSLIGLVPKHFIIALIENHYWYDETSISGDDVEKLFKTGQERSSEQDEDEFDMDKKAPQFCGAEEADISRQSINESPKNRALDSTIAKFTGDLDVLALPVTKKILPWSKLNVDFWSNQRDYNEVAEIGGRFSHKLIDLRPYMIDDPMIVTTTDKLPKVLELFRHFHLRALPVIDPNNGLPVAVLTRQDLFAYMGL